MIRQGSLLLANHTWLLCWFCSFFDANNNLPSLNILFELCSQQKYIPCHYTDIIMLTLSLQFHIDLFYLSSKMTAFEKWLKLISSYSFPWMLKLFSHFIRRISICGTRAHIFSILSCFKATTFPSRQPMLNRLMRIMYKRRTKHDSCFIMQN